MMFQKNIFSIFRLAEIYIGLLLCTVVLSMPSDYDDQPQRSYYPSKQYKKLFHSPADSTILKNFDAHQNCNVENSHLPSPAASLLPPPSDGLVLKTVVVGRGTQNYTCLEGPEDKPDINGAVAILLDATCIASKDPSKLSALSKDALQLDLDKTENITSSNLKIAGKHFFRDAKTAIFEFSTLASDLGTSAVKKQNSAPSPPDSAVGKDGEGFGAVPWLKLISAEDEDSKLREVYRIDTAGGDPPPTCVNMPKNFEIEYAAVYWFFGPRDKGNCA